RSRGMKLILSDDTELVARDVEATADYSAPGPQDIVILAVKAHQMDAVAHGVPRLFGPATVVVTMQNGIPYWYFYGHGGPFEGRCVEAVDPTGVCLRQIPPARVIGCVVYPAAELVAPGVIRHIEGDRFPVGELDGSSSGRVRAVSECFTRAGFKAPVLDLARLTETAVPTIEAVHALTKLLGKPLERDNQAGGAPAAAGR